MSNIRYIKLKLEKSIKKTIILNNYDELLEKIENFFPNDDSNKIYQIKDDKKQKIINDENDYQSFIKDHESEKNLILTLNLIDKNSINIQKVIEYQPECSNIFFPSCIISKSKEIKKEEEKEKELTEEEKIKESIRLLVKSKLKNLESSITNELISNVRNSQLTLSNQKHIIHKGVRCDECGIKNIEGVRYKCSVCPNYNLCEKCEEVTNHDENHLFVKINNPVFEESELNQKISQSMLRISKKREEEENEKEMFIVEPKVFNFRRNNLVNMGRVKLTNKGNIAWEKGFCFKCIKEKSNLFGNDVVIEEKVEPENTITLELIYEDDIDISKNNFYSSYKLIDNKDKQIGKISRFEIEVE